MSTGRAPNLSGAEWRVVLPVSKRREQKPDGRAIIYYTFEPTASPAPASLGAEADR